MKNFLYVICLISGVAAMGQPIGVINEVKEEVIVRSGRDVAFAIEGRLREGQQFRYWPEEEEDYWYIENLDPTADDVKGFVKRSQVRPFYAEATDNCGTDDSYDQLPLIYRSINGNTFGVYGGLLQRRNDDFIIVRRFVVQDCATKSKTNVCAHSEKPKIDACKIKPRVFGT